MEQKKQLIPFPLNTRQRRQDNQDDNFKVATVGGAAVNFAMDKVGFLSGFIIKLSGTVLRRESDFNGGRRDDVNRAKFCIHKISKSL